MDKDVLDDFYWLVPSVNLVGTWTTRGVRVAAKIEFQEIHLMECNAMKTGKPH